MLRESRGGGHSWPESLGWLPGRRDTSSEKLARQGWAVERLWAAECQVSHMTLL